ncbi:FecR family protein [Luteimonas sp. A277]
MDIRETATSIDQSAAAWAARLDRAPLDAEEEMELCSWLEADIRRQGALVRAQALMVQCRQVEPELEAPACLQLLPAPSRHPLRRRSGWMRLVPAVAASVLVAAFVVFLVDVPQAYATVKGETRTLPFADGSTVTLDTDTRIKVYDDGARIRLLQGNIFIQTLPNGTDPVIIEVSGKRLQATQAGFSVSKLDGLPEQVTVKTGEVEFLGATDVPRALVSSSQRLVLPAPGREALQSSQLSSDEIERQLAWRGGHVAFHGETLADAVKVFARYSDTQVLIPDPSLANRQVIGWYAANNPKGFARATATLLDARVEHSEDRVVIRPKD